MEIQIPFNFELDEQALDQQLRDTVGQLPFDRDIALGLFRENNIGFSLIKVEKVMNNQSQTEEGLLLIYRLTAQANEKCHFEFVKCNIDFRSMNGTVKDMIPGESQEGDPVKHVAKDTDELTLKFKPLGLTAKVGGEQSVEMDVYNYVIVAYGQDKPYARWEFRKSHNHELRLNQLLQLLVAIPASAFGESSNIEITLRFKLRADGILGSIPVLGRKFIPLSIRQTV